MTQWNPWRALRAREHIDLLYGDLPDGLPGVWVPTKDGAVIVLDHGLGRRGRNAALAHELVHDERGIAYTATTPDALVAKEEAVVEREVADRLVPKGALAAFVDLKCQDGGSTTVAEVAEAFDVPEDVAARALQLLADAPPGAAWRCR